MNMKIRTQYEIATDYMDSEESTDDDKEYAAVDELLRKCKENHGNVDFSITLERELKVSRK